MNARVKDLRIRNYETHDATGQTIKLCSPTPLALFTPSGADADLSKCAARISSYKTTQSKSCPSSNSERTHTVVTVMYSLFASLLALSAFLQPTHVLASPTPHGLEERYYPQGTISSPANGTNIMPGEAFDFYYNQRGDYCLSSMNFTVWLLTSSPQSVLGILDGEEVTGWYFGRYSYSGSGNEYPSNPAPSQLTMPDFSQRMGGFSTGETASSQTMYLAVLEEWNSCSPTLGHQFSLAANSIVYNGTNTSTIA